jgi:SRSO17 transposase
LVPDESQEDSTMPRRNTSTDISPPATTGATASPLEGGLGYWADMARRLAPDVARSESRQRVMASRRGWLREAERKHSWQVAEVCGEPTPDGFQYVLSRAAWEAEAVRDALRL